MKQEVAAGRLYFFEDFMTAFLFHFDLGAYGNHIFQRRVASTIDRCGMLSVVAFRTER